MDTKTKIFTGVILVALDIAFIGYYLSLYNGNENNVQTYTNLILMSACFTGAFFTKKKLENKFLNTMVKINGVLLVIWVITIVVQLLI